MCNGKNDIFFSYPNFQMLTFLVFCNEFRMFFPAWEMSCFVKPQ